MAVLPRLATQRIQDEDKESRQEYFNEKKFREKCIKWWRVSSIFPFVLTTLVVLITANMLMDWMPPEADYNLALAPADDTHVMGRGCTNEYSGKLLLKTATSWTNSGWGMQGGGGGRPFWAPVSAFSCGTLDRT